MPENKESKKQLGISASSVKKSSLVHFFGLNQKQNYFFSLVQFDFTLCFVASGLQLVKKKPQSLLRPTKMMGVGQITVQKKQTLDVISVMNVNRTHVPVFTTAIPFEMSRAAHSTLQAKDNEMVWVS